MAAKVGFDCSSIKGWLVGVFGLFVVVAASCLARCSSLLGVVVAELRVCRW